MTEYTERVDGFQIRDVCYLGIPSPRKEMPVRFDIVKWVKHEPREQTCVYWDEKGRAQIKYEIRDEYCFSVATLEWDDHEPGFDLHSVGLRWLEQRPSAAVIDMVLKFCEEKEKEILEEEGRL